MRYPLVAAALLLARSADGKVPRSTDADDDPTLVRGTIAGPIATFTVRFLLPTAKDEYTQTFASIPLPPAGLVTGGSVTREGVTHQLDLLPAAQAEARFAALAAEEAPIGERTSATRNR